MKIYCQYSNNKILTPNRGDFINEIGMLKALSKFADVYYSGQKFNTLLSGYGLKKYAGNIEFKITKNCDLYYVRNNKKIFQYIYNKNFGGKKIWMSSPYDKWCFLKSNIVATFTKSWEDMLKRGDIFPGLNPDGLKFNNAISIDQTIDDIFFPRQSEEITKNIRKEIGGDFIIGHFGRVAESTYPYLLLNSWGDIVEKFPNLRMITGVTTGKFPSGLKNVVYKNVTHSQMPYYFSACDMAIVSQHGIEWDICGNLKVKEPAACGIPVVLEKSLARCEEYGNDYEMFLPRDSFRKESEQKDFKLSKNILMERIEFLINNENERKRIGNDLSNKMKNYSVENSSLKLKSLFNKLLGI